jgi:hypothetical protein
MSDAIMICKLQLHSIEAGGTMFGADNSEMSSSRLRFGAVWEGSTEKQQMSENAIFGHWTPNAEFTASVRNAGVVEKLKEGKKYYVTFTEAPD